MKNNSIVFGGFILTVILLSSCSSREDQTPSQDIPKPLTNISVKEKLVSNNNAVNIAWTWYTEPDSSKVYTELPVTHYGTSCILSNPKTSALTITGEYNELYQVEMYPTFVKDKENVYFNNDSFKPNFQIIDNADLQTFLVGDNKLGLWNNYATDKDSLYFSSNNWCVKMYPFNRDTFIKKIFQSWELFSKDQDNVYFLMVECGDWCFITTFHKIKGADPKSFEVLSNDWKRGAYSKDSKYVYRSGINETWSYTNMLEWANPRDFTISSIQDRK